jgi:hypothetical protein
MTLLWTLMLLHHLCPLQQHVRLFRVLLYQDPCHDQSYLHVVKVQRGPVYCLCPDAGANDSGVNCGQAVLPDFWAVF